MVGLQVAILTPELDVQLKFSVFFVLIILEAEESDKIKNCFSR